VTYLPPATHIYRFFEICDSRDTYSNLHEFELHRPLSKGTKYFRPDRIVSEGDNLSFGYGGVHPENQSDSIQLSGE